MKICLFGDAGSIHIKRLATGLAARGMTVHVVCHKPCEIPGVTVEHFQVPPASLTNPRRCRTRSARYLKNFLRDFDVVNVHFLWDWGFTPEIMQSGCLVATAWGSDIAHPPQEGAPSAELTAARRELLTHAAGVTTCGPTFAAEVATFAGMDASRITAVPFGIDLNQFNRQSHPPDDAQRDLRVGFFKGFRAVYGPTFMARAIPLVLREIPSVRFEMVGDGPQLEECQKIVSEAGADEPVDWIPRQPHSEVPRWLARWDVSVIPSVCEAFGMAALESSAMGVPVVASNVCGLRDTVRDQQTGLLVDAQSPEALAGGMISLLQDSAMRKRMGQAGRLFVEEQFDEGRALDQWEEFYHRVCQDAMVMV